MNKWFQLLLLVAFSAAGASRESASLAIVRIGRTPIPTTSADALDRQGYVFIDEREDVVFQTRGWLPSIVYSYVLVRPEGGQWQVQEVTRGAVRSRELRTEVRLGGRNDAGKRFEVRIAAAHDRLPQGLVPDDWLARNLIATSEILKLVRRIRGPIVSITAVNTEPVFYRKDEILDGKHQTTVGVRARDLPDKAMVCAAVQPVRPYDETHWVMPECVRSPEGTIIAYFGIRGLSNHHRFLILLFVTYEPPPYGRPIPPVEWLRRSEEFLAESRPVMVTRWDDNTTIADIGGVRTAPNVEILAQEQTRVSGTLSKRLRDGEKLWLIALPARDDAYVAGWTAPVRDENTWTVPAAHFGGSGSGPFLLVAVISTEDPTKMARTALRRWVYDATERSQNAPRVRILKRL